MIGSLGARHDTESISDLAALVGDSDAQIALAAATALGDIGTVESAKALREVKPTDVKQPMLSVCGWPTPNLPSANACWLPAIRPRPWPFTIR